MTCTTKLRPCSSAVVIVLSSFLCAVVVVVVVPRAEGRLNNTVSALLVFGDSTVDPGNNNWLSTMFKSNFPPYGRDFVNHLPTGRFCNGRLATDFIASYIGIKDTIPPYLDPNLSVEELMSGVSFGSAGSGFDPLTPQITNVLPMEVQIEYLREYKRKVEGAVGKKRRHELIREAVMAVSAGTNDFIVNYYGFPDRRQQFTVSAYVDFLMQRIRHFLQVLIDEGARKIAVVGLPPMGCLPVVITLNPDNAVLHRRQCVETLSSVARDYNRLLQTTLESVQSNSPAAVSILFADIYDPLFQMIQDPNKYGFEEVNVGCCGSGFLETSYLCNEETSVCKDASKYVFWDAIHPTESAYHCLVQAFASKIDGFLRDGSIRS